MKYNTIRILKYQFTPYGCYVADNDVTYDMCSEYHGFYNQNDFKKIVSKIKDLIKSNIGVAIEITCGESDDFSNSNQITHCEIIANFDYLCNEYGDKGCTFISKKMHELLDQKRLPKYVKKWIAKFYRRYYEYG